jgi:hypothetical protein
VPRYHTRARQPSHWAAGVDIELRDCHGLPARRSDIISNESDERALGHRPNKSQPAAGGGIVRVSVTPLYCEADRNISASSAKADIGPARHDDKQRRRCSCPTSTTRRTDRCRRPAPAVAGRRRAG